MSERQTWAALKAARPDTPERRAGYERTRRAHELGAKVRELRESQGLTQLELAQRMKSTQSVVARLELGGAQPRFEMLERVARALGQDLVIEFRDQRRSA